MRHLSIVIPHYQKHEALENVMQELFLQISPEDQIIIVDDHSPDGKPKFDCDCTEVIQPPRRTPHIYRLCTNRNYGIQHAKHDAVIILDPDCIPNPDFIEKARKIFDPSVLFGGAIDKIQEDGSIKEDTRIPRISKWVDISAKHGGGGMIWGGVMMFSKSRTALVGWFDEDFNDGWGAEEHEFASRCFHSGMRLRYSLELLITHQWHIKSTPNQQRNYELWKKKTTLNAKSLGIVTKFNPAVAVLLVSVKRPHYIDQCMRALMRNNIPLRVFLVSNGDNSKEQMRALHPWRNRWNITVLDQEYTNPAINRTMAMHWAKKHGCKYLVIVDDDMTVFPHSVENLIRNMEKHKQYYAMSGWYHGPRGEKRAIGGYIKDKKYYDLDGSKITGIHPVDYVSAGFIAIRLNKIIEYDQTMEMGWNDWFWCETVKKMGEKLAVCANAGAYHRYLITKDGLKHTWDTKEYRQIRGVPERNKRMAEYFKQKWGWTPTAPLIWRGIIR